MKAVLNYWDEHRTKNIFVGNGDFVVAKETDCNLTEGFEYEVIDVNGHDTISVRNDLGEIGMYTVEWFDKSSKGKNRNSYVEIEAFVDRGGTIEVKSGITIKDFMELRKDESIEIKMANMFVDSNGAKINFKMDLNSLEDYTD